MQNVWKLALGLYKTVSKVNVTVSKLEAKVWGWGEARILKHFKTLKQKYLELGGQSNKIAIHAIINRQDHGEEFISRMEDEFETIIQRDVYKREK